MSIRQNHRTNWAPATSLAALFIVGFTAVLAAASPPYFLMVIIGGAVVAGYQLAVRDHR